MQFSQFSSQNYLKIISILEKDLTLIQTNTPPPR